jgi:hypothetical protein
MGTIIYPFGAASTLAIPTAKQASASYELANMFNILSIPTIDNRDFKLTITFDDDLPVGAIMNIRTYIAKGTGVYFATGSLTPKAAGFKIGVADADGTGHWSTSFFYDGVGLVPYSIVNLVAGKLTTRGV